MAEREKPHTHPKWLRLFYFWIGIIATFAYRIIVVLNNYSLAWSQIMWYVGTIGFIVYFWHRYQVSEKRVKLIQQDNLANKVAKLDGLNAAEKASMAYIFATLTSSKEKTNYIFIFVISTIALVWGIYLDFLR